MPTQGVGASGNWQGFADQPAGAASGAGGLIISSLWANLPPAASVPFQLRRVIDISAGQSGTGGGANFILCATSGTFTITTAVDQTAG